jgi:hypothetical protein
MGVPDQHLGGAPAILLIVGAGVLLVGIGAALRWWLCRTTVPDGSPSGVAWDAQVSRPEPPATARCEAPSAPRLSTVDPLGRVLDRSRRLIAAENRVARELASAPVSGWMVERYVLVGAQRIPFLVLGPGGLFTLSATDGAWTMDDLATLSQLGDELRVRLPGYRGQVHAVVCLAFDASTPRTWHGGVDLDGRGGWVLGVDALWPWLCSREPEHGIAPADLDRLHTAAGPHWRRRSTTRLRTARSVG